MVGARLAGRQPADTVHAERGGGRVCRLRPTQLRAGHHARRRSRGHGDGIPAAPDGEGGADGGALGCDRPAVGGAAGRGHHLALRAAAARLRPDPAGVEPAASPAGLVALHLRQRAQPCPGLRADPERRAKGGVGGARGWGRPADIIVPEVVGKPGGRGELIAASLRRDGGGGAAGPAEQRGDEHNGQR